MSLPSFPSRENPPTREEVINQIISSIAMEELGLSHVINAEGEKLQYALGTIEGVTGPNEPLTVDELLRLNESVQNTLNSNMMNQFFLKEKLGKALSASTLDGPARATGLTGSAAPFLTSYMEASADEQTVEISQNFVFGLDSVNSVGNNIELDSSGTIFTINKTGLYQVDWNVNLLPGIAHAVIGVMKNGKVASSASGTNSFSSGTLIEVKEVPFTISLGSFEGDIIIQSLFTFENSAASIRIVRIADGPSV